MALQLVLLVVRNRELVQGLLEVVQECLPLMRCDPQMLVRIGHRPTGVPLRTSGRPTDHLRHQILEAGGRHSVVGFVDTRIRVQPGVDHDSVDQIVDQGSNRIYATEPVVGARPLVD